MSTIQAVNNDVFARNSHSTGKTSAAPNQYVNPSRLNKDYCSNVEEDHNNAYDGGIGSPTSWKPDWEIRQEKKKEDQKRRWDALGDEFPLEWRDVFELID